MSPLVYLGLSLIVVGLLGLLAGYLHPASRPLVRKWGWLAAVPLLMITGAVFAGIVGAPRKRPGQGSFRADSAASAKALQDLGSEALARAADADADLARQRIEARRVDTNGATLIAYDDAVARARRIEDPVARRAALVALVGQAAR